MKWWALSAATARASPHSSRFFRASPSPPPGSASLRGRVASLLEVGTGFHPELTGRDNIFLNGAILGMKRAEIQRKFDEIVAFAEVERFLDTPVKHYSSGMYVRLAFAVAAHLEPDILVVDEVLSVGDAEFQKKCLNKTQEREPSRAYGSVRFAQHAPPSPASVPGPSCSIKVAWRVTAQPIRLSASTCAPASAPLLSADGTIHGAHPATMSFAYSPSGSATSRARLSPPWMCVNPLASNWNSKFYGPAPCWRPISTSTTRKAFASSYRTNRIPVAKARPSPRPVSYHRLGSRETCSRTAPILSPPSWSTLAPLAIHCFEEDVVAFQTTDGSQGDSARGDFSGRLPGAIRPLLRVDVRVRGRASKGL